MSLKYFINLISKLVLIIISLFTSLSVNAQTHTYDDIAEIAFNNSSAECSSPLIRNISVSDSFNIIDAKLGFNATHTYRGDIRVIIEHPDGTRATVINNNGGDGNNNYDIEVTDSSGNALNDGNADNTASPFYDRTASPSSSLTAFDGKNSAGTWKIEICDAYNGDSGTYNRSQLILEEDTSNPGGGGPTCGIQSDIQNNWPSGAFNYSENNIDGSGVNLTVAVTGETGQIPTIVGGSFNGVDGLDLRTNGFFSSGATFTYSFSQGLDTAAFDIGHVNRTDPGGAGGDSFTITGRDSLGNTIFPTFSPANTASYTTNSATGFINAIGGAPANLNVSFTDPDLVTQVIVVWNDCTSCNNSFHGMALGEMDVCLPTVPQNPEISLQKSVVTLQDPVNGTTNPKSIPGALAEYSIEASNTGPVTVDNNTTILTDAIPSNTALYVGDISGAGTGPIRLVDGSPPSGLSYSFSSLGSNTDSISFSNNNGSSYTYVPSPDADGVDTNVTNIRVATNGQFLASGVSGDPSFKIIFRVIVQ